jgi:hypothetical protein
MSRVFLDVTPEQHLHLKIFAAHHDLTLEEPVHRTISETEAFQQLEQVLSSRLQEIEQGEFADQSFDEIIAEARKEAIKP